MQREISELIKPIVEHGSSDDWEGKYIAISILSLKDRWPSLTENEKKEIEAATYAIYYLDRDVSDKGLLNDIEFPRCLELLQDEEEEDYDNEETEDYNSDNQYNITSSQYEYSTYEQPVQKKKSLLSRFLDATRSH